MSLELDASHIVLGFAALSAVLFGEAAYLLLFSTASYRSRINRRLALLNDSHNRESVLLQLRRERGLTASGDVSLPVAVNRLIVQSGLSIGLPRLVAFVAIGTLGLFAALVFARGHILEAALISLFSGILLPYLALRLLRAHRQKKFGQQFPDAIDIIVRSLRAGHPVPVAIGMVARELPDPVGSEFGIVADEITYGADLETAMRNLYFRVGQQDLPLFVTAVAIQGSTGGNLAEILENLSSVIRQRFKMRRKIKALAAEGRASALILSALPILMFAIVNFVAPDFYGAVWHYALTKIVLAAAAGWMLIGNLVMYKLVNFRI